MKANADTLATDLLNFFADRLKVYLKDKGIRHDLISAVFALPEQDDLVRLIARVDALNAFISSDDGANLVAAYKRAANIVRIEEKKDKKIYSGEVPVQDLGQSEAADLFVWIETAEKQLANLLPAEEFTKAMAELAKLRPIVDRFFDKVTVNADDPMQRNARLLLLARVGSAMGRVADFSKLEG